MPNHPKKICTHAYFILKISQKILAWSQFNRQPNLFLLQAAKFILPKVAILVESTCFYF
jgi:hypothetical protein